MIVFWKQGINGQFNTAADWSTDTVPTANDDVFIVTPGNYTVTVSTNHTIRTLSTASGTTLAITAGTLTVTGGTGTGANAGTISVDGAALAIGGTFRNTGEIELNSAVHFPELLPSDLFIRSNVLLTGGGEVVLGADGRSSILGRALSPPFPFPFFVPILPIVLVNADNTIMGAGSIGGPRLELINEATIIGNSAIAPLWINTDGGQIGNSGLIEGTTAPGLVIASSVANSGILEALGENARLLLYRTVTDVSQGSVNASGEGAHVDLAGASVIGGTMAIDSGAMIQSQAYGGQSVISGVAVTGFGTLIANDHSTLVLTNSTVDSNLMLMSNGNGSLLSVDGTVGPVAGTISGGEIEFKGPSSANITFAQGVVGTLKLDSSFTGTVAGFAGHQPLSFSDFFAFGDSTIDSGALQYLSTDLPSPPNPGLTHRLQNALAAGGSDSPVGVAGQMNSQILAADFGLNANTAYMAGGVVGGGGTNYAIAGALDAPDAGGGNDPGNGSIGNINQAGQINPNPQLLSTVDQIGAYLNSVGGAADPSALYLISSGANDVSYATRFTDPSEEQAYLSAQAQTLAGAIEQLSHDGAEHILVNPVMNTRNNQNQSAFYSQQLYADLDASGIPYIKSDVHAMVQDVLANPTAYGFTPTTDQPGVAGTQTESAFIEPDTTHNLHGWGLWGAPTTMPDSGLPTNQQYAYLSSPDAEQTHFFSDDQHLSAAGQAIQANLDYNLISDDAIDLTSLPYVYGNTSAGFSATTASSGTLTVTAGTQSANITLLGNYMAAAFATASDGTGGTLVMDETNQTTSAQLQALAAPHGP